MDSEDSRDASSGSESNDEDGPPSGPKSPASKSHDGDSNGDKSSVSRSRSSTPSSRPQSALSQRSQEVPVSPQENVNRSRSPTRSRSPSRTRKYSASSDENEEIDIKLNIRPHTPKTPESGDDNNRSRSPSPDSRDPSPESRDPSPDSRNPSPESRNPSPESRNPSPKGRVHSPENHRQSVEGRNRSPESRDSSPENQGQSIARQSKSPENLQLHKNYRNISEPNNDKLSNQRSKTPESIGPDSPLQSNIKSPPVLKERLEDATDRRSLSPQSRESSRSSSPASPRALSKSNRDRFDSKDDERASVKSDSSSSSRKSSSSRGSNKSFSRTVRRSRRKSNSSESSDSTIDSSRRKITKSPDTRPEEISDGDIDSDQEKSYQRQQDNYGRQQDNYGRQQDNYGKPRIKRTEFNITHEDLSDVSDLEVSLDDNIDNQKEDLINEDKQNEDELIVTKEKSGSPDVKKSISEKSNRPEEGEEQLDFEAEDGECADIDTDKDNAEKQLDIGELHEKLREKKSEPKEELEEGEVTDEDDVRPEETEPRPVCRFFSRGQCTWGASCRFLHPGVTDKGNYTMFEMIRPVVPGEFGREERVYGKPEPPLVESAWERGLRTAKEMLRKSIKRKEQDIDFEEKKMNLSLAQEEFDKENGYYGRVPSPEPRFVRHIPAEYPVNRPSHEEYYGRRPVMYEPEYVPTTSRERMRPYRELPSHRMPDYYNNKYEDPPSTTKRPRPKREVIVQRVEERQGRGDEWSDPWMRSKSPAGRRKERKRSYSSGSSYSSSSSSRTTTESSRSSYRSRSRSSHRRRRSRSRKSRHVSPSVIVSERKAANERAALMNPPAPKKRAPSPSMMRVSSAANPPAPLRDELVRNRNKLAVAAALARVKSRRSSRSSSGSSGSSSSDSDSSDSSSSSSRDANSPTRRPIDISLVKAMDALKGSALEKKQIKLNLKTPVGMKKMEVAEFARKAELAQSKKRPANSPPPGDPKSKKTTSRREELLKQLKAVEDAIAKKRSKVN